MARRLAPRRHATLSRRRVRTLSSTEVQRNFADVLNRVRYQGETVMVERGGERVCTIVPPEQLRKFSWSDLAALIAAAGEAGEEWASKVEESVRNQPPAEFKTWPR